MPYRRFAERFYDETALGSLVNVAAALIGVYILLALITSHLIEQIGALLNQRGVKLYQGIRALVGDAQLLTHVYDHPLISNLSANPARKPSYIPTRVFTLSFIDGIRDLFTKGPDNAVLQLPAILATPQELLNDIVRRVGGMPDGKLRQTLITTLQNADGTYEGFLRGVDALFEASMQRVSGWYKRWASAVLAALAAIIVIVLNADTLAIFRAFANSPAQAVAYAHAIQSLGNAPSAADLAHALPPIDLAWHFPPAGGWWQKILGLLITWFAVLLGAPFWFDLLQALVPVRMCGDKPAQSAVAPATGDVRDVQSAVSA